MAAALRAESPASQSGQGLSIIGEDIDLAYANEGAICQDTGFPTFEIKTPVGVNQLAMKKQIIEAVAEATRRGTYRGFVRVFMTLIRR